MILSNTVKITLIYPLQYIISKGFNKILFNMTNRVINKMLFNMINRITAIKLFKPNKLQVKPIIKYTLSKVVKKFKVII